MYVSRLNFHTRPGRTREVEERLKELAQMVGSAGGSNPRVLRSHFASLGAPDLVFEEEAPDIGTLERQMSDVTDKKEFQEWSRGTSGLLAESPKREIYIVIDS